MRAHRPIFATAAAGLALAAAPAFAQQAPSLAPLTGTAAAAGSYSAQSDSEDSFPGSWSGSYTDLDGNLVQGKFDGNFVGGSLFVGDNGVVLSDDGNGRWQEAETVNEAPPPAGSMGWQRAPATYGSGEAPSLPPMQARMPSGLPPQPGQQIQRFGYSQQEREDWLKECRHRLGDNGVGGAVIGGVLGGIAGNRIAGKGNRVVGTIAGAAVGAAAGAAIDKAEDAGRVKDQCEAYLERYEAGGYGNAYGGGYGYGGYGAYGGYYGRASAYGANYSYGYGYPGGAGCNSVCGYPAPAMPAPMAVPMMWVPVMIQAQGCNCHTKPKVKVHTYVTEEVIPSKTREIVTYEKVPEKVVQTKYVKTYAAPVKTVSTKYVKTEAAPVKAVSTKYVKTYTAPARPKTIKQIKSIK